MAFLIICAFLLLFLFSFLTNLITVSLIFIDYVFIFLEVRFFVINRVFLVCKLFTAILIFFFIISCFDVYIKYSLAVCLIDIPLMCLYEIISDVHLNYVFLRNISTILLKISSCYLIVEIIDLCGCCFSP